MSVELECQYCGAPLDEDEEFEHRTCIACMYCSGYASSEQLKGVFAGVEISSEDIDENRRELLDKLDEKWERENGRRS